MYPSRSVMMESIKDEGFVDDSILLTTAVILIVLLNAFSRVEVA